MVLLGTGNGDFIPTTTSPIAVLDVGGLETYHSGTIADVNGDGNPDLMVTISNWDNGYGTIATGWAVYFGDGTGKLFFNKHTYLPFPEGYNFPTPYGYYPQSPAYSPLIRDFDFDGKVDMLVATIPSGEETTRVTIYHGNGNGTFTPGKVTIQPQARSLFGYVAPISTTTANWTCWDTPPVTSSFSWVTRPGITLSWPALRNRCSTSGRAFPSRTFR